MYVFLQTTIAFPPSSRQPGDNQYSVDGEKTLSIYHQKKQAAVYFLYTYRGVCGQISRLLGVLAKVTPPAVAQMTLR